MKNYIPLLILFLVTCSSFIAFAPDSLSHGVCACGGYYMRATDGSCIVTNPETGGCSCPADFTTYFTGDREAYKKTYDASSYVCLNCCTQWSELPLSTGCGPSGTGGCAAGEAHFQRACAGALEDGCFPHPGCP